MATGGGHVASRYCLSLRAAVKTRPPMSCEPSICKDLSRAENLRSAFGPRRVRHVRVP
jgi:hypothetical protein